MYYHEFDIESACYEDSLIDVINIINVAEFALVIINVFLLPVIVFVTVRVPLHINLKCIIGTLCFHYEVYLVNRIFCLMVQLDFIAIAKDSEHIAGIIYNFVNVYYFQVYVYSQGSICFERFTATLFLQDYETNKRMYISRVLIVLTVTLGIAGAFVFIFFFPEVVKLAISAFAMANSIIGITLMLKLEQRNKRLLAQFSATKKYIDVPYTLSLRFQLDENIRSTQLIRNMFLLFGIANFGFAPLYASTVKIDEPGAGKCWQKLTESLLHTMIVTSATGVPLVALFSHTQYRLLAKNVPVLGFLCRMISQEEQSFTEDEVRQRSRYICGTEPYLFYSDIECSLHPVCPNGGMRLQVGCTNDFQCQAIHFESRCINSCCCTLPRLLETTTPLRLRDNAAPLVSLHTLSITLVTTFLYLAV